MTTPALTAPPATYTPEEVASDLRVTTRTIRAWILSGEIAAVRVGPLWRVPAAERNRLVGLPAKTA